MHRDCSDGLNGSEGNDIMERMLVVVFDNQEKALEAARALEILNEESVIALDAEAVVTKDLSGATTIVTSHHLDPEGTMGGTAVGSLIGMLGGPVGLAVGTAAGFAVGAATDFVRARVDRDFVHDVARTLQPGKVALVAEIDEEDTEFVDARMQPLGGTVLRRDLSNVADTAYEEEVSAFDADLTRVKAEYSAKRAERKRRLKARLDSLHEKLKSGPTGEL
jgi:uncharacterized membrane protein